MLPIPITTTYDSYQETLTMSSTEDRLKKLVQENLDIGQDPNLDAGFGESGVSSVDAVAFIKLVGQEFNVAIPPGDFSQFQTLRELAQYVDSNSG